MMCTNCKPEWGVRDSDLSDYLTGEVELCSKHAMTEKLAVALRELYDGFPKVDSRSERAQCVLREYDSEHEPETPKCWCGR